MRSDIKIISFYEKNCHAGGSGIWSEWYVEFSTEQEKKTLSKHTFIKLYPGELEKAGYILS